MLRLLSAFVLLATETANSFFVAPRAGRVVPPHREYPGRSSAVTQAVTDDQIQEAHGGWPDDAFSRRSGSAKLKRSSPRRQKQQQHVLTLEENGGATEKTTDPYAASATPSEDGSFLIRYSRFDNLGAA